MKLLRIKSNVIARYLHRVSENVEAVIRRETEISTKHLTPEIKLRLITENCKLYNATSEEVEELVPFKDPYWGFYWPGGQSASRFILDHPEIVKGKRILDFGSGCGATAIVAKVSGCSSVIANDIDETAEIAAKLNAKLNNVDIKTSTRNLINSQESFSDFDVVVLGDVFYDEEFARILLPWIKKLVKNNQTCLIGDPGRHALSKELNLKILARYELPESSCIENHGFKFSNVFEVVR